LRAAQRLVSTDYADYADFFERLVVSSLKKAF
jgi:hypothetical protein